MKPVRRYICSRGHVFFREGYSVPFDIRLCPTCRSFATGSKSRETMRNYAHPRKVPTQRMRE